MGLVSRLQGAQAVLGAGVGGEGGGGDVAAPPGLARPDLADQGIAVLHRHADVGDQDVRHRVVEPGQGLRHGAEGRHLGAALLEGHHQQLAGVGLVLHHHHFHPFQQVFHPSTQALDVDADAARGASGS